MKLWLETETEDDFKKVVALLSALEGVELKVKQDDSALKGTYSEGATGGEAELRIIEQKPTAESTLAHLKAFDRDFGRKAAVDILKQFAQTFDGLKTEQYSQLIKALDDARAAREKISK